MNRLHAAVDGRSDDVLRPPFLLVDVTRFEMMQEGATWLVRDQALRSQRCYVEARRYPGTDIPYRVGGAAGRGLDLLGFYLFIF
jgi:hypothetical protein